MPLCQRRSELHFFSSSGCEHAVRKRKRERSPPGEATSLLTASFDIFSGLVVLSTWCLWLLKIERDGQSGKQNCGCVPLQTHRLTESDPDRCRQNPLRYHWVCTVLHWVRLEKTAPPDMAMSGTEGKHRTDCINIIQDNRQNSYELKIHSLHYFTSAVIHMVNREVELVSSNLIIAKC